jgi:hypothetical protein
MSDSPYTGDPAYQPPSTPDPVQPAPAYGAPDPVQPTTPYGAPAPTPYAAPAPTPYPAPAYGQPQPGQAPADGQPGQAPYYGQPPGAAPVGYPGGQAPNATAENSTGTAALILGILGLTVVPFIASIIALVLGYKGRRAADQGRATNRSSAVAGIITGWIGIVLWIVAIVGIILFGLWAADQAPWYDYNYNYWD